MGNKTVVRLFLIPMCIRLWPALPPDSAGAGHSDNKEGLWIHHYGGSALNAEQYHVRQETNYPWDGTIKITVEKMPPNKAIHLRVPGWARRAEIRVNGEKAARQIKPGTYARLTRRWQTADEIVLRLPLDVQLMIAHPKVEADRGQVAVMRGPMVYCLESTDVPPGVRLSDVTIPTDIQLTPRFDRDLLGGVTVLERQAQVAHEGNWSHALYKPWSKKEPEPIALRLVPYYAWANRGVSEMSVWLPPPVTQFAPT